ncbi:kinesin-like protein KIF3B, partial [Dinothrombium tinctorium]
MIVCESYNKELNKTAKQKHIFRILHKPQFSVPLFQKLDVIENSDVFVNMTATAYPSIINYAWFKNGVPIIDTDSIENLEDAHINSTNKKKKKDKTTVNDENERETMKNSIISESSINNADLITAEKLAEKIRAIESKFAEQKELEKRREEIAEQKRREREILQKLEEKEESTLEIKETFTSLQQEVELKKRKLRKLFAKLQLLKAEIKDCQEANARERRELEELQSELMKELKLYEIRGDEIREVSRKVIIIV